MSNKRDIKYLILKRYDGMKGRCYRPTDRAYKNYGLKGTRVCTEWLVNIESFKAWMLGEIRKLGLTDSEFENNSAKFHLDRIDSSGHYCPENCRLVPRLVNFRNKPATTRYLTSAEGDLIDMHTGNVVKSTCELKGEL